MQYEFEFVNLLKFLMGGLDGVWASFEFEKKTS